MTTPDELMSVESDEKNIVVKIPIDLLIHAQGFRESPFIIEDLKPIQMPNVDLSVFFAGRAAFSEDEWLDALLRSTGMEPANFNTRVKWHLLARMIPLVRSAATRMKRSLTIDEILRLHDEASAAAVADIHSPVRL